MRWSSLPLFVLALAYPALVLAFDSFENTAIVRTVELGGALVHVTTTYAVKSLENGAQEYVISLGEIEQERTSWLEARIKGQSETLMLQGEGFKDGAFQYSVFLPKPLATNATTNLVVETVQTHATYPWPAQAGQGDEQILKYEGDLFVLSPYKTTTQRVKVRAPVPRIVSHTTPEGLDEFITDNLDTKSGATITYGPFSNLPPSANPDFIGKHQRRIAVQYHHEHPVVEVLSLERTAEISHWGANLNIENKMVLHNAGPKLKGHFSRLAHQGQAFYGRLSPHILPALSMHLPPGAHSAYFTDLNGNVSTSRFRAAPSVPKASQGNQYSYLELRPRFPLMGGWNYTFTLGWDSPLKDSAGYNATTGEYVVGVPVYTAIPGAVVDDATVKLILPEGATHVQVFLPFEPLSEEKSTHITYLDTTGRPAVTYKFKDLTDRHTGLIYMKYQLPLSAHLQKPKAVAVAFLTLFAFTFILRRIDFRLVKA